MLSVFLMIFAFKSLYSVIPNAEGLRALRHYFDFGQGNFQLNDF